jgi:mRNA-degrading endonuclease RelE of RelBE toxin-antitoxin system
LRGNNLPFDYDFSDELEETLTKLFKKNKKMYEAILKKAEEVSFRDETTIDFYKNLKYDLKEFKRVHILKSFVLMFKVFKEKNFILFDRFDHHDNIYKKRI